MGKFPKNFALNVGREIVYILATRPKPEVEGEEWERIFANAINAKWKPSNVGLDDVVLGAFAWGAKTVKATRPHDAKTVRLISGRNSPSYSFNLNDLSADPQILGSDVLKIWNARVEAVRDKFSEARTIVLIKSNDLSEVTIFEFETVLYPPDRYSWKRNSKGNLEGYKTDSDIHVFTWQPHGSQFTIIEPVPSNKLCLRLKKPPKIDREKTLKAIGFEPSWIEVITP